MNIIPELQQTTWPPLPLNLIPPCGAAWQNIPEFIYPGRPSKPSEWCSAVSWEESSVSLVLQIRTVDLFNGRNLQRIPPFSKRACVTIWQDRNLDKQKKDDQSTPDKDACADCHRAKIPLWQNLTKKKVVFQTCCSPFTGIELIIHVRVSRRSFLHISEINSSLTFLCSLRAS